MKSKTGLSHLRSANVSQFWFGAAYYPEHWDDKTRASDPGKMAKAGFNIARMAEFAWNIMEPKENSFEFSFFDDIINKLAEKGISTMLCTPTAAPPCWLTMKHPETLRINDNGIPMSFGSRQHCCHSNPVFRKYSKKITLRMAGHFRDNPNVVGWQTDNELNCHFSECHCPSCQKEFQEFLKLKYKRDIDLLNRAWGTAFWAQTYSAFEQISTPKNLKPAYLNPAHQLDYYRFINYNVTRFQHDQVEILRNSQSRWFITHNGTFQHIDYRGKFTEDLDFLGYDFYPFFCANPGDRAGNSAFNLDAMRSLSGNFMIPEHQSGPGGQAPYFHDNPEPGEIRCTTYRSIAHGADSLLYFRWRTCRFGAEEYWCGIIDHDNIPRRRYEEIGKIGAEIKNMGDEIIGTHVYLDCAVATGDFEVFDAYKTYTLGLPEPVWMAAVFHKYLNGRGYAVGCVHPADDLSGLKLYAIPNWELFNPDWIPNLENYVKNGGVLLVGARTATRDMDNNVIGDTPPGCLRKLAGINVEEYGKINVPEKRSYAIKLGKKSFKAEIWYEVLSSVGAEPMAVWADRHLEGKTAVSINKYGKGLVIYAGTYLSEKTLEFLMPVIISLSGLKPLYKPAEAGIECSLRTDGKRKIWFFLNGSDKSKLLARSPKGIDLLTGKAVNGRKIVLKPYEVAIISENRTLKTKSIV